MLELSSLERAIARLDEGWIRYQKDITETGLRFAFEDSDLPWTVDIVDMFALKDSIFRQNMERDRVELDWRGADDGE